MSTQFFPTLSAQLQFT